MNEYKICPSCSGEFYPHIEKCADCGVVLLTHEEHEKALLQRRLIEETAVKNAVAVREGDLDSIRTLETVLLDAGIPCMILSNTACGKGCCGDKWRLAVSPENLVRARDAVEEYHMELDPELRTSRERLDQGRCPACGSDVGPEALECPDCGLQLVIIEDGE